MNGSAKIASAYCPENLLMTVVLTPSRSSCLKLGMIALPVL